MKRRLKARLIALRKNRQLFWLTRGCQLFLLTLLIILIPIDKELFLGKEQLVKASPINFTLSDYPQKGNVSVPIISAKAYLVIDGGSGVTLSRYQSEVLRHPASLTKLMTALVALDFYSLDQALIVKRLALVKDEAEMGLGVGDRLTVRNLLYGLLVPSGNDAAYAISDNFPGGIENFIYSMNKKASKLSLNNTHFQNQNGADQDNHLSTAKDLLNLARVVVDNDEIKRIVATSAVTLSDVDNKKNYQIKNVNKLLGAVSGLDGIKTGFTDLAGQCLITSTTRDRHTIYTIVLGSSDRFFDSAALIYWAFANTTWEKWEPPSV